MAAGLVAKPLTRAAFTPFGDVIARQAAKHFDINDGMATRYHDLAAIDAGRARGHPALNIFHGRPWKMPLRPKMMERHALGSQAFMPLGPCRWLVVVARPGDFDVAAMDAFLADGGTGVNYHPGTWHHPLVVLDEAADFLVVDRVAPEPDCDVVHILPGTIEITLG